jgi:hypothetical protein
MRWSPRKHTRRRDASGSDVAVDPGALFECIPTLARGWPHHCASREKRPKNPRCETGIDHSGIFSSETSDGLRRLGISAGQACGGYWRQEAPPFGPVGWQINSVRGCSCRAFISCGWHDTVALTHGVGSAWASPSRSTTPTAPMIAISAAAVISTRCVNFLIISSSLRMLRAFRRRTFRNS